MKRQKVYPTKTVQSVTSFMEFEISRNVSLTQHVCFNRSIKQANISRYHKREQQHYVVMRGGVLQIKPQILRGFFWQFDNPPFDTADAHLRETQGPRHFYPSSCTSSLTSSSTNSSTSSSVLDQLGIIYLGWRNRELLRQQRFKVDEAEPVLELVEELGQRTAL